jgi:hypothetical protein
MSSEVNKYTLGPAEAVDARIEEVERERDALAASLFVFKGLYLAWDTRQIDDDGFHTGLAAYAGELPGTSLIQRDAQKQAQALEGALAAIDRDPLGAREEISGMLLFLRSQHELEEPYDNR